VAQLRRHKDTLDALNTTIAVIGFVDGKQATDWLHQTKSPFPLLIDPARMVYRAYDLKTSFWRVWNPKVMWHYARLMLAGQRLRGIQGDPHQLGGDFVVDGGGVVHLAHYSQDPTDRLPVDVIFDSLQNIRGQ
jgi:hypothetical protein